MMRCVCACALLSALGCETAGTTSNDDLTTAPSADLSSAPSPDLTTTPGADLLSPPGADLANASDLAPAAIDMATSDLNGADLINVPVIYAGSATGVEGQSGTKTFTFTIQLSAASAQTVSVDYLTADDSATVADNDYQATAGTLTFTPGMTSRTITVTVAGDTVQEENERFFLKFFNAVNATLNNVQVSGNITNDDSVLSLVAPSPIVEGNSGTKLVTFTVMLTSGGADTVTVQYASQSYSARSDQGGLAGPDFVAVSGTLTFAPGVTSRTFDVTVNGDTFYEGDEQLYVSLSSPSKATIAQGASTAFATITNDDLAPTISIADATCVESDSGSSYCDFKVTQSALSAVDTTFRIVTADGTAGSADYTAASCGIFSCNSSGTIDAGTLNTNVQVRISGDTIDELDETFTLSLSMVTNATVADGSATATITDDDPTPSLSINDVTVNEGSSGNTTLTFTVSMSNASSRSVTVGYATSDGSATTTNFDYTSAASFVTFSPGQTSRTFTIQVTGDTTAESNETFSVTLSNPTNATIVRGTGTATIVNDD
jgi:large repetitive protein